MKKSKGCEKKPENFSEYAKDWCIHSTFDGLSGLVRTNIIIIRVIWICSLLICSFLCVYFVVTMTYGFFSFKVITTIKVQKNSIVDFPAVTICNLFPFDKRNAKGFIDSILAKNNLSTARNVILSNMNPKLINTLIKSNIASQPNSTLKQKFGFDLDYMLLGCFFNGEECNSSDFIWRYDYDFTNCYTFNSGYDQNGNKVKIKTINEAGSDRSFRVELLIGEDAEQSEFILNSGARIVVHNQSVTPIISSEGKDISTQFQTNIAVSRSFVTKLGYPYSDCIKNVYSRLSFDSHFYRSIFDRLNMKSYRKKICFRICLQEYIKNICSCLDGSLPNIYANMSICDTIESIKCIASARVDFFNDPKVSGCKDCPQECDTISYNTFSSSSRFPTPYYLNYTLAKLQATKYNDPSFFSKALLAANIFYDELDVSVINEVPSLTLLSLFSNIGGMLGLFLGPSALSFFEIVEFVIQGLMYWYQNKRGTNKNNSKESVNMDNLKQSVNKANKDLNKSNKKIKIISTKI